MQHVVAYIAGNKSILIHVLILRKIMAYLSLLMLLPSMYIVYLLYRWLYHKEANKKNRIHHTKRTIWLILISWIAIFFLHRVLYGILSSQSRESFWLYSLIYYLGTALVLGYSYISVKATKSRKNLTKLMVTLSCLGLFLPLVWWNYSVFHVGVYGGKFGVNKKAAMEYADEFIGSRINHSFVKATVENGHWLVVENLRTYDSKSNIDVKYIVDLQTGRVSFAHSDKLVPLHITRQNNQGDALEMMLFVDRSSDPKKPDLEKLQYTNTDADGNTLINIQPGTDLKYYVQVRDCSFSCTSNVFKLKAPIKDKYDIIINPYQPLSEI